MTNQENQNNITVSSDAEMLDVLDVTDIYYGILVRVKYEGEIFLGKVLSVVNNQTQVWCLKHPLGILEPQEFELEDSVFHETVYANIVNPVMVKNGRKWMWKYWDKTFTFVL